MAQELIIATDRGAITSPIQAGGNVLSDSTKLWKDGLFRNYLVRVTAPAGGRELAIVDDNIKSTLVIRGLWLSSYPIGSVYEILAIGDLRQALRDVFGGGSDISAANPLETHDPKVAAVEDKLDHPDYGLAALKAAAISSLTHTAYTEDSTSGNSGGDGAWHDALDVDTRGMKSFSAVVTNTDGANSLNWRLRARPSNYSAGADEEIPECPGSETLAPAEKGLAELIKSYSRIKIQVQDTVAMSAADYTIDYLINR